MYKQTSEYILCCRISVDLNELQLGAKKIKKYKMMCIHTLLKATACIRLIIVSKVDDKVYNVVCKHVR